MVKPVTIVSRLPALALAFALAVAMLIPALLGGRANADQISTRSVQMSNSEVSATSVEYKVRFNVATTGPLTYRGFVVDFCSNSPLIGLGCNLPTNFSLSGVTVTARAGITGVWTVATANSDRTLLITKAAGDPLAGGATVEFDIEGITNPDTLGTFYARVLTYVDDDDDSDGCTVADDNPGCYTAGTENDYTDAGGMAMSTTSDLVVNAKVQEKLTFCIYVNAAAQTCATGSGTSIDIPDSTTPLENNAVLTNDDAWFGLASNALNGVDVRMWGNNGSEGVLKIGTYTISAFGPAVDDACTADSANTAIEQFGMRFATTGASVTADAPYNCAAGNHGWDADNTAGAGANDTTTVGSEYGDRVASTAGANDEEQNQMEFAAKAAITTEAGIYTTALNFIATGSY